MALEDGEKIKGVTIVETREGFDYSFDKAIITTNTQGNYMNRLLRNTSVNELVKFKDIANKLGASNIDEYVRSLAERGDYSSDYNPATETAGTAQVSTGYELSTATALKGIGQKLDEVIFLLKSIAEA